FRVTGKEISVTPLRQRMLEEVQRRNYSPETTCGYIFAVREFAEHYGKSPEQLGAEELRRYQVQLLHDRKLAPGTVEIRDFGSALSRQESLETSRSGFRRSGVS
ncbi:MAG TPA: phage integrase N-terminal SAM-like domain-containing protein, partial [Bryobacteraceae bacterium]|nr:phage integrase N-terminal SAM-like domain-containing protein [Bryobacteraceae bacterium]